MVEHFPPIEREMFKKGGEDRNPAVQLFGRRFFGDQTVPELLVELLLVASSGKRIGETLLPPGQVFPGIDLLRAWPQRAYLEYAAKARLNLKLFAFLGASKLETRHASHREHYERLHKALRDPDRLKVSAATDRVDVLRTLQNLFLGFQGVGGQRTWCAQAFIPFSRTVIAAETLWNETQARRDNVQEWDDVRDRILHFFSLGRHRFLARGGELLYLQLCNALRQDIKVIQAWCAQAGLSLSSDEYDPELLHAALQEGISSALEACPETVGKLADFIDTGVESETAERTDKETDGKPRFTRCGWCPTESWPEGLLFGVELLRLCPTNTTIDPIERLELMEIACAMQLLRSLCAQSARYAGWPQERRHSAGPLSYVWVISDPEGQSQVVKQISRRCVNAIQRMIFEATRHPDILEVLNQQEREDLAYGRQWRSPYKEADTRYGHKLFLTVAKRIGLIVPKRGAGARFVLNDRLLRFLVMSVIRPGERVTYETFKKLVFAHYGIAMDDERIGRACSWCGTGRLTTLGGNSDRWVEDMLDASGVLVRLSDSCSLVKNPFDGGGKAS